MDASALISTETIRVLLVEHHQVVAEALAALLNDQPDITVVGIAESVAESRRDAEDLSPDVVVLDYHLGDGSGLEAALAIRSLVPHPRLVFLTRDDGDAAHLAAFQAGASAFIHKSRAATTVVDSIRKVAAGEVLIAPHTDSEIFNAPGSPGPQWEQLSTREREVLRLVAMGVSNRNMASVLEISYDTVRTHIRGVERKLGVHSKLHVVAKARELALVD